MPIKLIRFKNTKFQPWVTRLSTHDLVCVTKEHMANILLIGEPYRLVKLDSHYQSFKKNASRDCCKVCIGNFQDGVEKRQNSR